MKRLEYDKVTVCETTFTEHPVEGELMTGQNNGVIAFLCPCGCGESMNLYAKEYADMPGRNWKIIVKDDKVTLWPSVNATGFDCKSHFWIRDNKVIWV